MRILIILLFLTSCSTIPKNVSPELSPYVSRFLELYRQSLDVKLADTGNFYHVKSDHVRIKLEDWYTMSASFREMLMMHELGHGILRRLHKNDLKPDGCPVSLMHWKIDEPCYKKYRKEYLEELFTVKGEF